MNEDFLDNITDPNENAIFNNEINQNALIAQSIDADTADTQKRINDEIHKTDTSGDYEKISQQAAQMQDDIHKTAPELQNDKYEGSRYQAQRNTGVAYFDNKRELGLLDAYLAKKLGLDIKMIFHKIDMKTDNTHRVTNYRKNQEAIMKLMSHNNESLDLMNRANEAGITRALKGGGYVLTKGAINFKGDATDQKAQMARAFNIANNTFVDRNGNATAEGQKLVREIIQPAMNANSIARLNYNIVQKEINDTEALLSQFRYNGGSPEQIAGMEHFLSNLKAQEQIYGEIIKTGKITNDQSLRLMAMRGGTIKKAR